jgi:hypothetical protein
MSQSRENVHLPISAFLTMDDENEPQAVTVTGYGNMSRSAVRAIAEEALERFTGLANSGYRVQLTPILEGDEETEGTVFEIYKYVSPAKRTIITNPNGSIFI